MKNLSLKFLASAYLLLIVLVLASCKKDSATDLSGSYTLYLNQTKNLGTQEQVAKITATAITDNRCPLNVNCPTAGAANVKLIFEDQDKTQEIELCLGECAEKERVKNISFYGRLYTVSITEIETLSNNKFSDIKADPNVVVVLSKP